MSGVIAIIGLGLIGGSLALGLKGFEGFEVVGVDVSEPTLRYAREHGVGDAVTANPMDVLPRADMTILCLHPQGIVRFLDEHRNHFKAGSLVTDVCGVKSAIMAAATVLPPEVDFIGCHPMAGTEFSGIEHAFGEMFRQSHLIITPRESSGEEHIALLERMGAHLGCQDVVRATPARHDQVLAYTSQMMHVIALAVCDDSELFGCKGFEGSSFRGCTRVAALDVALWTQLFSMNAPALTAALERLEGNLRAYRETLSSGDTVALSEKLAHASARKRQMDLHGPDTMTME